MMSIESAPTDSRPIGVFGLGDLGTRLTAQLLSTDKEVVTYDPAVSELTAEQLGQAIDPALDTEHISTRRLRHASVQEILEICGIIHWAVPSSRLTTLAPLSAGTTMVLHDSVMANSQEAIRQRDASEVFAPTHCVMSDDRRVLVDSGSPGHDIASTHFRDIGLAPKSITAKQHDTLMARSQGVFALLIEGGLKEKLNEAHSEGDLTPSAIELLEAINHRASRWTPETIGSILRNPELRPFLEELLTAIKAYEI